MYNHGDTHCFGRNIRPVSFASEECTVTPFLEEYSEKVNIPIYTGSTSYTMELGKFIILWFGNRMEKNLIKPNQCQGFGIPICDDPTNQNKPLGIEAYLTPISQCQWWDPHVDLLLGIPQMKRLRHVETVLFQMNTIEIHQKIFTKFIQWRRSKGATCSTSVQSIK